MNPYIKQSVQNMCAYTPGEQPTDPRIIKLNTNENPYPPSPAVMQALAGIPAEALRRYPDPVCRRVREVIARLHGGTLDNVFAGNGSDEILALCTRAFVEDAGSIGYMDPSYGLYHVMAQIRNVETRPVTFEPDYEWQIPADYRASFFYLTTPNAPTGIQYPRETVAGFCRQFPGVVLLDEAYVDFADTHFMDMALTLPNVLVLRTLSKAYSLAGVRFGYVVGPAPLIAAMYKIKDSYNVDYIAQQVARAALEDQAYMKANAEKVRQTRGRLAGELVSLGFKVYPSSTNFLWIRPPSKLPAASLFQRLREQSIVVRYFDGPRTKDYVRITVGTGEQTDALLNAIRLMVG